MKTLIVFQCSPWSGMRVGLLCSQNSNRGDQLSGWEHKVLSKVLLLWMLSVQINITPIIMMGMFWEKHDKTLRSVFFGSHFTFSFYEQPKKYTERSDPS